MSTRIPVYHAERRLLDISGRTMAAEASYGFGPLRATRKATEFGDVERDASELPRLAVIVPPWLEGSLQDDGAELVLVLRDCGRIVDMLAAREAVEAAAEGRHGLMLSRVAPAPLFSAN